MIINNLDALKNFNITIRNYKNKKEKFNNYQNEDCKNIDAINQQIHKLKKFSIEEKLQNLICWIFTHFH
jgi:vacuolar-type H+-ATPase subunit I/STV1